MAETMAKVMIVEDDVQASTFLAEVLTAEGYVPIVVNVSAKAVSMANATLPDAFLLDLMMPEPDGFKLCRMLRNNPNFVATPIIIVTALDDTDSRIVAFGAGANDYIVKPFHIDVLSSKLKTLLKK
ncbi:MAG TPA: response regulator transcription factor [Anaerolineales bacterium]|nr:response regulator transcription factor [Anaerolineales bacterium]